jgi:hypothetical protein
MVADSAAAVAVVAMRTVVPTVKEDSTSEAALAGLVI